MGVRNPEVDAWFADRDQPLDDARQRVRQIILGADDRITGLELSLVKPNGNISLFEILGQALHKIMVFRAVADKNTTAHLVLRINSF